MKSERREYCRMCGGNGAYGRLWEPDVAYVCDYCKGEGIAKTSPDPIILSGREQIKFVQVRPGMQRRGRWTAAAARRGQVKYSEFLAGKRPTLKSAPRRRR